MMITMLIVYALGAISQRAAAHSTFPDGATDTFTPDVKNGPGNRVLVSFRAFGREFSLDLAPGDIGDREQQTSRGAEVRLSQLRSCVRRGVVDSRPDSLAVLSLCGGGGLRGLFAVGGEHFEVAPVEGGRASNGSVRPHSITRTHASFQLAPHGIPPPAAAAATVAATTVKTTARAARSKRFVSRPRYVQVLAVADDTMVAAYGDRLEEHLLTVLSAADGLLRRASLGSPVRLTLARVVVASGDKAGSGDGQTRLEVSSNAAMALRDFCKWQLQLNRRGEDHPERHDTAVLFTRKDLCGAQGCETLGMADVGTVCDPERSCAVVEDDGLQSAFTVTHELGHVLGMPHDDAAACTDKFGPARARHLMASVLSGLDFGSLWSQCSAASLMDFLDDGQGDCLLNKPHASQRLPSVAPGSVYGADRECQLAFGPRSLACPGMDVCQRLWCTEERAGRFVCLTKNLPAAEGTPCGHASQCLEGACVPSVKVKALKKVDGQWGEWGAWSECSRSCGGGVQLSSRGCDAPQPRHGGAYCVGQRVQYRSCSTLACGDAHSSALRYREEQCAAHNARHLGLPGLGDGGAEWLPKYAGVAAKDRCKLTCRARSSAFYAVLAHRVADGTECGPGVQGVCVRGRCVPTGCDRVIGSRLRFDRCARCGGDGSTCRRVSGSFSPKRYGYNYVVAVPAGATNLDVRQRGYQSLKNDDNYLAVRSGRDGRYLLNGHYVISTSEREVALGPGGGHGGPAGTTAGTGSVLSYSGTATASERLHAPGALTEPLVVEVLAVGRMTPPRVRYSFHVPRGSAAASAVARSNALLGDAGGEGGDSTSCPAWHAGGWSPCSKTCGRGFRRRSLRCEARGVGVAPNVLMPRERCDRAGKPQELDICVARAC
ncbi:unnamed protein product [Lampetra fluviatilis]